MTKMDMVWIATATLIRPRTGAEFTVTKDEIVASAKKLFGPGKIEARDVRRDLVNSVDRQADKNKPTQGGDRKRYLFQESNGEFRLYKTSDQSSDGWDKHGPTHPAPEKVDAEYASLLTWYEDEYKNS